jgi:hypothetical protein
MASSRERVSVFPPSAEHPVKTSAATAIHVRTADLGVFALEQHRDAQKDGQSLVLPQRRTTGLSRRAASSIMAAVSRSGGLVLMEMSFDGSIRCIGTPG